MFSILQKLITFSQTVFSRGVPKTTKQRLKRSREVAIEASDQAWVNSNANPFNKVDLHSTNFAHNQHNPRATGTHWSKLHTDEENAVAYTPAYDVYDERREAFRRSEIVREQLQKRGQILRNLHLANFASETETDLETELDDREENGPLSVTQIADEWGTSESLTGDFCSLEVLAELETTVIEEKIVAESKSEELSDSALEQLAINLLKPTAPPPVQLTPAQMAAQVAAKAAQTIAAKTHARLQALQVEQGSPPQSSTKTSSPKPERSPRPPKIKVRDTEVIPPSLREKKIATPRPALVEYKASILPSEESRIVETRSVEVKGNEFDKPQTDKVTASDSTTPKPAISDTHEKIAERFAYRSSPEHALKLIAQSPDTPPATLARLAGHENPHIRTAVARNQSANSETLWNLARDYEASIRYSLAESTHTPLDILRALTKDRNQLVAWVAQNSLNSLKKRLGENASKLDEKTTQSARERIDALLKRTSKTPAEQDIAVLEMTARADDTSAARLGELANHENARVRAAVAENSNTPLHALWSLVRDVDPNVKINLTYNCNCPAEILEVIKNDKDSFVAQKAKDILKGKAANNGKFGSGVINAARNQIRTYLTWP